MNYIVYTLTQVGDQKSSTSGGRMGRVLQVVMAKSMLIWKKPQGEGEAQQRVHGNGVMNTTGRQVDNTLLLFRNSFL